MAMIAPRVVTQKLEELMELVNKYPIDIPVKNAAAFLGMDIESLQCCIANGQCTFALGWQKTIHGRKAFHIPTFLFYQWCTRGAWV